MSIKVSPGPGLIANQIILFIFAGTIYDAFNVFAMLAAKPYG